MLTFLQNRQYGWGDLIYEIAIANRYCIDFIGQSGIVNNTAIHTSHTIVSDIFN